VEQVTPPSDLELDLREAETPVAPAPEPQVQEAVVAP